MQSSVGGSEEHVLLELGVAVCTALLTLPKAGPAAATGRLPSPLPGPLRDVRQALGGSAVFPPPWSPAHVVRRGSPSPPLESGLVGSFC